ncbi:hypothetical protein [Arundinibacter roseus]|uniref:Uncharacterized protein n=1 Tax=Arundinibacter roseus TaxID=2070510 RepID=A0A4R4KBS0_9BACT|nr:hypothetical protein [Arundinibacter roseus]TDB65270.1 hypothetical protein EZE20_11235 [Arundinibacter roseus]
MSNFENSKEEIQQFPEWIKTLLGSFERKLNQILIDDNQAINLLLSSYLSVFKSEIHNSQMVYKDTYLQKLHIAERIQKVEKDQLLLLKGIQQSKSTQRKIEQEIKNLTGNVSENMILLKAEKLHEVLNELMYDFYEGFRIEMSNPKQAPKIKNKISFFLILCFLGKLNFVNEFKIDGSRDEETIEMLRNAAIWAMKKFNYETNLDSLETYLSDVRPKFYRNIPNATEVVSYHFPERIEEIKRIETELKLKYESTNTDKKIKL